METIDLEWVQREGNRLYEEYGKPLEKEHWGEFAAVTSDGRWVLASTLDEVIEKKRATLGPGCFIFKVGEKAVGGWL